jgi:hypothetical protein
MSPPFLNVGGTRNLLFLNCNPQESFPKQKIQTHGMNQEAKGNQIIKSDTNGSFFAGHQSSALGGVPSVRFHFLE